MDAEIAKLHIAAGLKSGQEKTCGKKTAFADEASAQKAAGAHNRWEKRRHDVEPYPCAFCQKWHIGGIMPIEVLRSFAESKE